MTCKECESREIGCHTWCRRYREYRDEKDRILKIKNEEYIGYHDSHMSTCQNRRFYKGVRKGK